MSTLFKKRGTNLLFNYVILLVLMVFSLGPMAVLLFNSVKSNLELGQNPLGLPSEIYLSNFVEAWVEGGFATTMFNSVIFVTGTVAGVLILGGMAAYSLARLNPRGGGGYMVYMLTLSTLPFWLYVIPLFILWRNLGLLNSRVGLMVIYIALNSPFSIFLLRSFLLSMPRDFEDAARVDGANEWQVLARVVLPIMWPAFLTVGLVVALAIWGEFQVALIFLQDDDLLPVTTSYYNFQQRFGQNWALTSAGAVMMIAPVLVFFFALQRRFIEGLTQGGLKL